MDVTKYFKRGTILLLIGVSFSLILVACSGEDEAETDEDGRVVVDFWHSMRGDIAESLEGIVDDFNESQDDIKVEASFQGTYGEATTKVKQVLGTDEAPSVMQIRETKTKEMIDSGGITPMQEFVDDDDVDTSDFVDNILEYYTVDDQLYSMPFNASNGVLFYNKDMFEEAGLDPDNPPQTYSEVRETAEKLTVKEGDSTEKYGITLQIYGWLFGQLMSNQGELIVDNDNGRSASAEEAVFNQDRGVELFEWINEMYEDDIMGNFGRKSDDMRAPFYTGETAMILDTTAKTADHIKEASFEVGAAYLPHPDDVDPSGPVIGGASMWIFNSIPEEEQEAAWEFVKFLTNAENQAQWAVDTGYFPVINSAYDENVMQKNLEEYPQFKVAIDQLNETGISPASLGALMGIPYEDDIADAWEEMYDDKSPQEVLDEAAEEVTKGLEKYNKTSN